MVPLASLWLPILLSAVVVFLASAILHMVFRYHFNDFRKLPREDEVMAAVGAFDLPPGEYAMPYCASASGMKDPDFVEKMKRGPAGFVTIRQAGQAGMGKELLWWFVYCVIVSVFAGYVTSRSVGADADYLAVFRLTGTVAFAAYALGLWQDSIWYSRSVSTSVKNTFDGLVYALLTAGVFGWLW